ncbi:hypothetical protein [Parerythrobacter aestuarii]|uniref:hypothetical protein n=1 Tax=Parerythrobacter aestuarii TaxID=3020909 RepID=UPI0024DE830A|nr:hypothetical protein [Parerythrobacter aestuarii]
MIVRLLIAAPAMLLPLTMTLQAVPAMAQEQSEEGMPCDDTEKVTATRGIADPVETLRALYDEGMDIPQVDLPLTDRLYDLMLRDDWRRGVHDTPIARIDFDWIVNGQDALISDIEVEGTTPDGLRLSDEPERMVVTARFKNFDTPNELDYYWEKGPHGWRLDDVVSRGERGWVLSLLLGYGR